MGKKYFVKHRLSESIEAEEIFLDAEAVRSMEEKGKLEKPIKGRNFIGLFAFIVFSFTILFFRTGYLQIARGEYYWNLSQGNRLKIYSTTAPRGIIYDRNGQSLLYNIPSFDLVVSLADFFDNPLETREEIITRLAEIIKEGQSAAGESGESVSVAKDDLRQKLEEARGDLSQLILVKGMERDAALILETLIDDWPGVRLDKNAQRQYAFGGYFSHILGYTGEIGQDDLENKEGYFLGDRIGKDGLERQYENVLKGEAGQKQIEVDYLGKTRKLLAVKQPRPGNGLVLSIDKDLQEIAGQALEKMIKSIKGASKGAVIAVNPKDGGIMAMVSLPSFDNNVFAQGISEEELSNLENDPAHPFLNRAIAGQYPSGSIVKPLIAAAALQENIINPRRRINCPGIISVVSKYYPEIVYNFPDWKAHGPTDTIDAIAQSCNVYFYTIGGGYQDIQGLGGERIKKYLEYFGLGQPTGIDLPHEENGLIPDENWRESTGRSQWTLGDTYHLSIGQGDLLVTPLQMAMAMAAAANGGILYQPQLVDKIIDPNKKLIEDISPSVVREGFIRNDYLEIVQEGMRQAVVDGSSVALSVLPVRAAGKTGTAQFGNEGKTHAWFAGYAPDDEPEIVLIVLLEGGGEGHAAAVPVAKEILEWYFSK